MTNYEQTSRPGLLFVKGCVLRNRSVQIMSDVLHSTADNDIDYFFIDLSKLIVQDNCFPNFLFNMVSALGLMGGMITTGVTPTLAKEYVKIFDLKNLKNKMF
ncbi:hypothetical protein SAMN05878482_102550 [Peribacillus simplex]|uniref:STAS domain-containing protein n=1 Tax=Peribacillus simplex TaxID=1478 RepID=A0A9X8R7W0_9BACI|nr:hypothetical protein [Peribacillus simplex]SIQ92215.1 hypothetical protein SAMN05878482_102550 [Peribacillus simplex]